MSLAATRSLRLVCCAVLVVAAATLVQGAGAGTPADVTVAQSMQQFLTRDDADHAYRAFRRIEAENRGRTAWLEAWTELTPDGGFEYEVVAEGGSSFIRSRVLRGMLEGEKEAIARGEPERSALAAANYRFESEGVLPSGLVKVALLPKRNDGVLVEGAMFLTPLEGELVRLEGRLAKSPSFWVKHVDIVRSYARLSGAVLPVMLETEAQLRFLGPATLRMSYHYAEIDGGPVVPED